MLFFLAIQCTYESLEIGLYQGTTALDYMVEPKITASKYIIVHINTILTRNNITIKDLSFIAASQGPAPFTSLRVVLATVNGLQYATNLPLIGIDGLAVFINTYYQPPCTLALLNAYNNDCYYALRCNDSIKIGCKNIDTLLEEMRPCIQQHVQYCIGNAALLFAQKIKTINSSIEIPEHIPLYPPLDAIAQTALTQYRSTTNVHKQLFPLYLKGIMYTKSINS